MTETTRCPHCGSPAGAALAMGALESLYREVARIREIAERADAGAGAASPPERIAAVRAGDEGAGSAARIAELTREINELRATVARLRGSAAASLAHSAQPPPRSLHGGEFDLHDEAAFRARARVDRSVMCGGDGADDGQAKAGAPAVVGPVGGKPPERLEQ